MLYTGVDTHSVGYEAVTLRSACPCWFESSSPHHINNYPMEGDMSTKECFFATHNGDRTGRASHFYASKDDAATAADARNAKALALGVSFMYTIGSVLDNTLTGSEKVR